LDFRSSGELVGTCETLVQGLCWLFTNQEKNKDKTKQVPALPWSEERNLKSSGFHFKEKISAPV